MDTPLEARQAAALALDAGMKLAQRSAQMRRGLPMDAEPTGGALGALISDPLTFWSGAAAVKAQGDQGTVGAMVLGLQLASARLAAGDLGFVRDSLLGQAQWLSVMTIRLAAQADGAARPEQATQYVKLALQAQRQAATCLASAAALGRLGVEVVDD